MTGVLGLEQAGASANWRRGIVPQPVPESCSEYLEQSQLFEKPAIDVEAQPEPEPIRFVVLQ
ncbi:hypothetical protein [Erwinia tasmaniensis]|uniref:hypothetical protein n=1 Tax=Erwinia tasmaniensis TaxID=338565 RepID=UPI0005B338CE|nr:hypothetical protein [Erwinia tasmaniensis]